MHARARAQLVPGAPARARARTHAQMIVASTAYVASTLALFYEPSFLPLLIISAAMCALSSVYGAVHCCVGDVHR